MKKESKRNTVSYILVCFSCSFVSYGMEQKL